MTLFCFSQKSLCYTVFISRTKFILKHVQKFCTSSQPNSNVIISPDDVLSKANRENCMKLMNSIKEIKFSTSKNIKKAAVLVPLVKVDKNLALLYTQRALHLKVNGGEIAFPGGMFDESDGTLEKTALREAHEEVGLEPSKVDIWGRGPEIHRPDVIVTPVLAYIDQFMLSKLKLNPSEVATAFPVTLENLSFSKNFRVTRFRAGKTSIFVTPVYLGGEKRIWGLTAYITHIVLRSLISDIYKKNINFQPRVQKVVHFNKKFESN